MFIRRVDDYANGKQIEHLFKWNVLLSHFIPYRMNGLWTPFDLVFNAQVFKLIRDWGHELFDELVPGGFSDIDLLDYGIIDRSVCEAQVQILELRLHCVETQAVSEGRIKINGFRSYFKLLVSWHAVECTHVMQPVRQLDEDHPDVFRKGEQHLTKILSLL